MDAQYDAARRAAPYADDEAVRRITEGLVRAGHSVFQIHRLADTDAAHVAVLLDLMALPEGAEVLDAGCGVGAVADLMREQRRDLSITLLNVSPAQLAMCPEGFPKIAASFEEIPAPAGSFDAVLFLYSLGHGRLEATLAEAARVLKPGGVVFIYDLTAQCPDRLVDALGYVPHTTSHVLDVAARCGLRATLATIPRNTTVDEFLTVMDRAAYEAVFAGVAPVIYRMVKA